MNYNKYPRPIDDGKANHLLNTSLPDISLLNQQQNLLKLKELIHSD